MHGFNEALSKTGLFKVAKQKPVRPVTSTWLVTLGFLTIAGACTIVFAAYIGNLVAACCAAAASILVLWIGVAFLWHSVAQLNTKIEALTNLVEKKADKID